MIIFLVCKIITCRPFFSGRKSRNNILLFSYEYNSRNQLIKSLVYTVEGILTVEYEYNYLGDRISKAVDGEKTSYTLEYSSGLSQVIEETTDGKTVFYVRGLELISREETSGTYFYIMDGGNTVRDLIDEDGTVTDKYIFDSFGNEVSHEGDSTNSYGFQGEQLDEETGLYYLRARYMNSSTGTFTSMDTYGGSLSDPTSLHKYLFANSNPVKYCDPTGHDSIDELVCSMAIAALLDGFQSAWIAALKYKEDNEKKGLSVETDWLIMEAVGGFFSGIIQSLLIDVVLLLLLAIAQVNVLVYVVLAPYFLISTTKGIEDGITQLSEADSSSVYYEYEVISAIRSVFSGLKQYGDWTISYMTIICPEESGTFPGFSSNEWMENYEPSPNSPETEAFVAGYWCDVNGRWHRPNNQFASNAEIYNYNKCLEITI